MRLGDDPEVEKFRAEHGNALSITGYPVINPEEMMEHLKSR